MVEEISPLDFEEKVLKGQGVIVVDCYADWCMPCKLYAQAVEEAAETLGEKVKFYKLNVDYGQSIAAMYGVQGIPTTLLFVDGFLVKKLVGAHAAQDLINWIKTNAKLDEGKNE